ncbi:MAG: 6-bladed beta-propeller [Candidatus Symbiothrix sp.]|jgi:hypothetical protein|nr:6-bladed beta-propeller [Candidatus Symbiothrix sp.]
MKYSIPSFASLVLVLIFGCTNHTSLSLSEHQIISVPDVLENIVPQDSLFSAIDIVPLETSDKCLIRDVRSVKIYDSLIYINSGMKDLLVFDFTGKFKQKIASRGNGPGEYLDVRDFVITQDHKIEILDFKKILTYTLDGEFVSKTTFDFMGKDIYSNPVNFTTSHAGGYFLWGGYIGIRDAEARDRNYMMHLVNKDMQIQKSYFPIGNGDGGMRNRFTCYNDTVLIAPYLFGYDLYQIDQNDSLSVRYHIDFGKYSIAKHVASPEKHVDMSTVDWENHITNISNFVESDDWICVSFHYQTVYTLLHSKQTHHNYCFSTAYPLKDELRFYPVSQFYNNKLLTVIDADWLVSELDRITPEGRTKWNLEQYKSLNPGANPVLIFYTFKTIK